MTASGEDSGSDGSHRSSDHAADQNTASQAVQRLDPARSACVLIGVDDYVDLAPLKGVAGNVSMLKKVLSDPSVWGIPQERITVLRNPGIQWELTGAIKAAAAQAEDTLLVYYAGHGLLNWHDSQLYLTIPVSNPEDPARALSYNLLRQTLLDCRESVKRRILILDCCYSGRALNQMSARDAVSGDTIAIEGSYVLTSTPENQPAFAPQGETYTAFTGELIRVLTRGCAELAHEDMLTLNQIHREVSRSLTAKGLPKPQREDRNGVGDLLFVRNPLLPGVVDRVVQPYWNWRKRLLALSVLTATAVTAGTLGVLWEKWADRPGTESPAVSGPCGSDKVLLQDTSSALDGKELHGEQIKGLSALALSGSGQGYVLADDDPGRIYPISLGAGEKLAPSIDRVRDLYRKDGTRYDRGFDGEGLVLEKGGQTILVSNEATPAIRRFDLRSGKELGEVPLPERFHFPPVGEAQRPRNVESLTATQDGRYLFVGLESALSGDDDKHGQQGLRIQRYRGTAGGTYRPDRQYAYESWEGTFLSELVALDENHLLALERGGVVGFGSRVRVSFVDLSNADDVTDGKPVGEGDPDAYVRKVPLFDLADCPQGAAPSPATPSPQTPSPERPWNGIVENAEGMALGPVWKDAQHKQRRLLYLISDDNGAADRVTRVYKFAIRLP